MDSNLKFNKIISRRFNKNKIRLKTDFVAIEMPLEIGFKIKNGKSDNINILMRTPGDDDKLAIGFLISEGIINSESITKLEYVLSENKIEFIFNSHKEIPDISHLKRNFISNSSCGICGKESLDELLKKIPARDNSIELKMNPKCVESICDEMRKKQKLFSKTGGVHGIAIFDEFGKIICIEEDVGRHNALDKAIGAIFMNNQSSKLVGACLSGRASYEMVQKAAMVGIQILICMGAPTSLAIDLAASTSITLIGFVSEKGYNIYTNEGRILSNIN
ncbi:MAG: formate dehydrogenase family accessory protein FdhD [Euryarchaeota archaeon]|nr:formate dehydrogenase family accessory protein FdhD [Euryarchaeota archaeon]|tara:strand:+ start:173 stop:1000 length:828 start_codon:yes stop_codon:yes gene_type:complete